VNQSPKQLKIKGNLDQSILFFIIFQSVMKGKYHFTK